MITAFFIISTIVNAILINKLKNRINQITSYESEIERMTYVIYNLKGKLASLGQFHGESGEI